VDRVPPGEQEMQGIPLRSGEIVEQLLARLPDLLGEDIAELLQRLEEALSSSPASIFDQPPCCRDSMRALLYKRAQALPALLASLRAECEALAAAPRGQPAEAVVAGRPQVLRLQDEDSVDEEAALASIARRHASRASFPLLLLGQRFGVLFARPAMNADALPVGPRAFCRALCDAATHIGLCAHTRMALYRLYDVDFMDQYPRFAEAFDALVDEAGILPGLAYVPLRRNATPVATAVAQASEQDALQSVNRAAEALAPNEALPARMQGERQEAIFAMARYLLRHGRDSTQWSECIGVADALLDAARIGNEAPEDVERWLRRAIGAVGYAENDAGRLAAGLTTRAASPADGGGAGDGGDSSGYSASDGSLGGGDGDAGAAGAPARDAATPAARSSGRGVREQRCFDRLLLLDPGAMLGFSAGDGTFLHLCVNEHLHDPARMLLASPEDKREIVFEVDMLARLVASGQAWVMRTPVAGTAAAGDATPARAGVLP
jgi:uncharacterized membrane protein YgcG